MYFPYSFWNNNGYNGVLGVSLIPFMTSNTQPLGLVTSNGLTTGSGNAFLCLSVSGVSPTGVYDNFDYSMNCWLQYQFVSPVTASSYSLSTNGISSNSVTALWGSSDGSTWNMLDSGNMNGRVPPYHFTGSTYEYWRFGLANTSHVFHINLFQ